jgi:hypothetical protein
MTSNRAILEPLKAKDKKLIESLTEEIVINLCNEKEIEYLTKASELIDYNFQLTRKSAVYVRYPH